MTNEEAFRKWRTDYESDYDKKPSYLEVWQAAISYMQEQSEPVAWATFYENGVVHHVTKYVHPTMNGSHLDYKPLFTTPQRQQPLKRLSEEQILKIGKNLATMLPNPSIDLDYANAIMDEMERINK